jgi:hypothetical protein
MMGGAFAFNEDAVMPRMTKDLVAWINDHNRCNERGREILAELQLALSGLAGQTSILDDGTRCQVKSQIREIEGLLDHDQQN